MHKTTISNRAAPEYEIFRGAVFAWSPLITSYGLKMLCFHKIDHQNSGADFSTLKIQILFAHKT